MSNPEQPWTPSDTPPAPPAPYPGGTTPTPPQAPGAGPLPYSGGYGGYPAPATQSGKAIAILVLGICGLMFMCAYGIGVVPAIVALALAPSARREITASGGRLQGDGFIKAGVICSWVTIGIAAVLIVAVIVAVLIPLLLGAGS